MLLVGPRLTRVFGDDAVRQRDRVLETAFSARQRRHRLQRDEVTRRQRKRAIEQRLGARQAFFAAAVVEPLTNSKTNVVARPASASVLFGSICSTSSNSVRASIIEDCDEGRLSAASPRKTRTAAFAPVALSRVRRSASNSTTLRPMARARRVKEGHDDKPRTIARSREGPSVRGPDFRYACLP